MAGVRRILSIDGGGIRGIIPAMILAELEARSGQPVSELFDLIAGTSTGGILALGLNKPHPDDPTQPHYSASELVKLYEDRGKDIFSAKGLGIADEKYPSGGIESILSSYFGEVRLSEALNEVLVTAYEIEQRKPYLFKSRHASNTDSPKQEDHDFLMWEVARATSAAPTYFEPVQILKQGTIDHLSVVDGGVFANNPALCAYVESIKFFPEDDVLIVSLGTGQLTHPLFFDDAKDWGLLRWARQIIDIVFDGVNDNVEYLLARLVPPENIYRFQVKLDNRMAALDRADLDNIKRLKIVAQSCIDEHDMQLNTLVKRLQN